MGSRENTVPSQAQAQQVANGIHIRFSWIMVLFESCPLPPDTAPALINFMPKVDPKLVSFGINECFHVRGSDLPFDQQICQMIISNTTTWIHNSACATEFFQMLQMLPMAKPGDSLRELIPQPLTTDFLTPELDVELCRLHQDPDWLEKHGIDRRHASVYKFAHEVLLPIARQRPNDDIMQICFCASQLIGAFSIFAYFTEWEKAGFPGARGNSVPQLDATFAQMSVGNQPKPISAKPIPTNSSDWLASVQGTLCGPTIRVGWMNELVKSKNILTNRPELHPDQGLPRFMEYLGALDTPHIIRCLNMCSESGGTESLGGDPAIQSAIMPHLVNFLRNNREDFITHFRVAMEVAAAESGPMVRTLVPAEDLATRTKEQEAEMRQLYESADWLEANGAHRRHVHVYHFAHKVILPALSKCSGKSIDKLMQTVYLSSIMPVITMVSVIWLSVGAPGDAHMPTRDTAMSTFPPGLLPPQMQPSRAQQQAPKPQSTPKPAYKEADGDLFKRMGLGMFGGSTSSKAPASTSQPPQSTRAPRPGPSTVPAPVASVSSPAPVAPVSTPAPKPATTHSRPTQQKHAMPSGPVSQNPAGDLSTLQRRHADRVNPVTFEEVQGVSFAFSVHTTVDGRVLTVEGPECGKKKDAKKEAARAMLRQLRNHLSRNPTPKAQTEKRQTQPVAKVPSAADIHNKIQTIEDVDEMMRDFVCPISLEVMADPVIAADGHSYQRTAIEEWLKSNDTSPLTGEKLPSKVVMPNLTLRKAIHAYVVKR